MQQANWKEILLGILTAAAGLASGYIWKDVIAAGAFSHIWFYSLPVALLIAYTLLFLLSSAFISSRGLRSGAAILSLAANYLFIPYTGAVLSAVLITSAGAWFAAESIHKEARTANYFSARKILRAGLPVFFTALSLVLAVFYYSATKDDEERFFLPRALFDRIIPFLEKPLGGVFPGFKVSASANDILFSIIARSSGEEALKEIPPAERERLINKAREELGRQLGITITGS